MSSAQIYKRTDSCREVYVVVFVAHVAEESYVVAFEDELQAYKHWSYLAAKKDSKNKFSQLFIRKFEIGNEKEIVE